MNIAFLQQYKILKLDFSTQPGMHVTIVQQHYIFLENITDIYTVLSGALSPEEELARLKTTLETASDKRFSNFGAIGAAPSSVCWACAR